MAGNLKYGFDNGNGHIVPLASWENVTGNVNYFTGHVHINFEEGIPQGKGYVQVAYAPLNRQARAISMSGGVLSDVLERNAVRIYRLPSVSSVSSNEDIIKNYKLHQNYPNPFNLYTKITFTIWKFEYTSLKIYDILGHEVITLADGMQSPGQHTVEWNGTNSSGNQVTSGVYFYQLKSGNGFVSMKKMILLR